MSRNFDNALKHVETVVIALADIEHPYNRVAHHDRVALFHAIEAVTGKDDYYELISEMLGFDPFKGDFNNWHARNWPASDCSACKGEHAITLFRMKVIRWREEGLL